MARVSSPKKTRKAQVKKPPARTARKPATRSGRKATVISDAQKITPFLWFDDDALEAAEFYVSLFPDSKVLGTIPGGAKPMGVQFQLAGTRFHALNGGPMFKFTEAFSLFVTCEDQAEVDRLWSKLTANGGSESRCGWLKDRWGLSWQIVPQRFNELMGNPDANKRNAVMGAMMKMSKFDIAALERAAANA